MITKNFIVILLLYIGRFCCYCASSDEQVNYDKKQLTDDIKFNLELEEANEIQNEKNESTESSDVIAKNLNALKELLKDEKSLNLTLDDNKHLLKFLRHVKYDEKKAFNRIKKYYNFRQRNKEVSVNLVPSSVKRVYEQNVVELLPNRDNLGRRVFLVNVKNWDPAKIPRNDLFRAIEIAVELVLLEPKTQMSGVVAIVDFEDMAFKHLIEITPGFVSMALEWVQDIVPAKIGGVYVVNNSFLFTIVYNIIKPFMGQDLRSKFYVKGNDYHAMAKMLGQEALLKKHGGLLDNNLPLGKITANITEQFREEFEKMATYGYKTA